MATNLVDEQTENVTERDTGTSRRQDPRLGRGGIGLVTALVTVLLIGSAMVHDRLAEPPSVASGQQVCDQYNVSSLCYVSSMQPAFDGPPSTAQYYDDLMSQQDDFIHTMATRADALPSSTSGEQGTISRVSDSTYFVPVAGGMWKVVRAGTDSMPVIEDYVSGPPPDDGIAVTP